MSERLRFERELSDLEVLASPSRLPLILAGPVVRRATPDKVWFWFACSKNVTSCIAELSYPAPALLAVDKLIELGSGETRIVRLGENIWIVLVSAVPRSGRFKTDTLIGYDLRITTQEPNQSVSTRLSEQGLKITYSPFRLPTFIIGEVNRNLVQGSCRRPGAAGEDAFRVYDEWLAGKASAPLARPASLILTGDQIYADDVALPLFESVHRIALDVFGYVEQLPQENGAGTTSADTYSWQSPLLSKRKWLTHRETSPIGFTTEDGEAHLLSFPEYAAMYLAVWNPDLCNLYRVESQSDKNLIGFCKATQACRRVMANTATYMLCDDHEITDDWNLDQDWEDKTKKHPLARRIIANGLAAYWSFQAWGNAPDTFDDRFIEALSLYFEQLRRSKGYPRNIGSRSPYNAAAKYEDTLLNRHWSFMAATNPPALCVDTRTRRETPKGESAILSGRRVWPYLEALLKQQGFRKGAPLLLVLPTPFLAHRSLLQVQTGLVGKNYKFPQDRYLGDFELYGNNPRQRAELVYWLHQNFDPSALIIFSGDVHHGSVITGRYGHGSSLSQIRSGKADWVMRIAQITSSPIKNVKTDAYVNKKFVVTDAGNAGESLVPQVEHMYTSLPDGNYLAMQAAARKLSGRLGRETYIFENHLCVVDMPAKAGGNVRIEFVGVKNGKLATANVTVDTDNNPAKFQVIKTAGFTFTPTNESSLQ